MNNAVKAFIEDNIDLINNNDFITLLNKAYENMYDNAFMRELCKTFDKANIDIYEARDNRLYNMLEEICSEALTGDERNLHRLLDNENNWFGYDIYNVIDFIEQIQYNLGIKLIPIDDRIFKAPNYWIEEA